MSEPLRRLIEAIDEWLPGLLRPKVALLSALAAALGIMAPLAFIPLLPLSRVHAVLVFVGMAAWAQAVAWMMSGELESLPSALAEFDGPRWAVLLGLALVPLTVFLALAARAAG